MMKKSKIQIMVGILVGMIALNTISDQLLFPKNELNTPTMISQIGVAGSNVNYIPHGKLWITKMSDLSEFPGSGNSTDPYIISGYNITGNGVYATVRIENLNVSILMTNCLISVQEDHAVVIYDCSNVQITNCIFTNMTMHGYCGVYIGWNCNNISIIGNKMGSGVYLTGNGTNIDISNNYFEHPGSALIVNAFPPVTNKFHVTNLTFSNNIIIRSYSGIEISNATNLVIRNNLFYKCVIYYYEPLYTILDSTGVVANNVEILKFTKSQVIVSTIKSNTETPIVFRCNNTGGFGPFLYAWNFSDGSTFETSENPIHTFAKPGLYRVNLTVMDRDGDVQTAFLNIEIYQEERDIPGFSLLITLAVVGIMIVIISRRLRCFRR